MKTAFGFSTAVVSVLFGLSFAPAASAEAAGWSPPKPEPRTHLLSGHLGFTPFYAGMADRSDQDDGWEPLRPLYFALSGDYQHSFGLVRLGIGLEYSHTWSDNYGSGIRYKSHAHELGIPLLLSFGGTTEDGIDISGTLGLGLGQAWVRSGDETTFRVSGPFAELSVTVAVPLGRDLDFSLRTGATIGYFEGSIKRPDFGPDADTMLIRVINPFELGLRKRF